MKDGPRLALSKTGALERRAEDSLTSYTKPLIIGIVHFSTATQKRTVGYIDSPRITMHIRSPTKGTVWTPASCNLILQASRASSKIQQIARADLHRNNASTPWHLAHDDVSPRFRIVLVDGALQVLDISKDRGIKGRNRTQVQLLITVESPCSAHQPSEENFISRQEAQMMTQHDTREANDRELGPGLDGSRQQIRKTSSHPFHGCPMINTTALSETGAKQKQHMQGTGQNGIGRRTSPL